MQRKSILLLGLLLLLVGVWGTGPVAAASLFAPPDGSFTTNITVPWELDSYVPCALGGAGEWVHLTGSLHAVNHVTVAASGGYEAMSLNQTHGSGYGATSGAKYQGMSVAQSNFHVNGLPFTYTMINTFKVTGQGPGNNFKLSIHMHSTVNANGEVTAEVDNFSINCK